VVPFHKWTASPWRPAPQSPPHRPGALRHSHRARVRPRLRALSEVLSAAAMSSAVVRSLRTLVGSCAMRPPCVDFERAKAGATKADKRNGELSTTLSPLFPALGCGPPRQDHLHARMLLCVLPCCCTAAAAATFSPRALCQQKAAERCMNATSKCLRPRALPRCPSRLHSCPPSRQYRILVRELTRTHGAVGVRSMRGRMSRRQRMRKSRKSTTAKCFDATTSGAGTRIEGFNPKPQNLP
jgi:hypothetical protein